MEGKTMILSVLIMSLVMAQIQVEAKSCCPSTTGRNIYNTCRFGGGSRATCASLSGCKVISGSSCPSDFPRGSLETSGDAINEYCELGCVSSVCGALTTLQTSDANEIMNRAVGQCTKACSTLCAKGHMNALEIV